MSNMWDWDWHYIAVGGWKFHIQTNCIWRNIATIGLVHFSLRKRFRVPTSTLSVFSSRWITFDVEWCQTCLPRLSWTHQIQQSIVEWNALSGPREMETQRMDRRYSMVLIWSIMFLMKYKFWVWQFCGLLCVGSISITYDFYWWLNWCIGLPPT